VEVAVTLARLGARVAASPPTTTTSATQAYVVIAEPPTVVASTVTAVWDTAVAEWQGNSLLLLASAPLFTSSSTHVRCNEFALRKGKRALTGGEVKYLHSVACLYA
jgi:hypothetical protein